MEPIWTVLLHQWGHKLSNHKCMLEGLSYAYPQCEGGSQGIIELSLVELCLNLASWFLLHHSFDKEPPLDHCNGYIPTSISTTKLVPLTNIKFTFLTHLHFSSLWRTHDVRPFRYVTVQHMSWSILYPSDPVGSLCHFKFMSNAF